ADAAVAHGMTRKQAYLFVSQTVLGAAKMLRDTGEHPGALKDAVCSPGGTTIAGVLALEKAGLRNAVIEAVDAAITAAQKL
ncbi:MAG: pyrroline-5-carboxylate reductase, partial [Lachnospiraceae bacterium]|nr:pyrroline-5-carboxylate reductase [Lachnospiraceae bacterium]